MQDDQPTTDTPETPPTEPATPQNAPADNQPSVEQTAAQPNITVGGGKPRRRFWLIPVVVLLLAAVGAGAYWLGNHNKVVAPASSAVTKHHIPTTTSQQLTLDPSKNYGNKYKSGIVPVGDGKYQTTGAKQGYVYACSQYAQNLASQPGGAMQRGPWFTNNNTEYDLNKKVHVHGSVMWSAEFSNKLSGGTRTIITNDLPSHPTGVFPILTSDAAYSYDHNPNAIKGQTFTYALTANPTYGNPTCIGGQVGVMLTGVALFSGFDAGGRDAGAWEVQDNCSGHPQVDGIYHYHTLSSCIKDVSVRSVIGYALDGFPITGPEVAAGNILTTSDLDACHGITSSYSLGGKTTTGYHYVMTQDFPYSVSCYSGTAIQPPGQAQQRETQGTTPAQNPPGRP